MFFGAFRKTIGLFFLAVGLGVVLATILPPWCFMMILAAAIIILRLYLDILLREVKIYENSSI